jgi:hypothetical protein
MALQLESYVWITQSTHTHIQSFLSVWILDPLTTFPELFPTFYY